MKNTKQILLFCCLLLGWLGHPLWGQKGFVSLGDELTGPNGMVSYSVGQLDYLTHTGPGGSVAEGLQQPYEIWVVTGAEIAGIDLQLAVYPNPTTAYVVLQATYDPQSTIRYRLFDMSGQLLQAQTVTGDKSQIELAQYTNGTYLLEVQSGDRVVKSFKINKTL